MFGMSVAGKMGVLTPELRRPIRHRLHPSVMTNVFEMLVLFSRENSKIK